MRSPIFKSIRSSISAKLVAVFLLCLILPMLALGLFYSYKLRQMLMAEERRSVSQGLEAGVNEMDDLVQEMNDIISSLAISRQVGTLLKRDEKIPSYDWFSTFKAFENILQTVAAKSERGFRVTAISAENNVYHSGAQYNAFLTADSPLVKKVADSSGAAVIVNRTLEQLDGSDMLTVGKAFYERRQLLGVVLVDVPLSTVDKIVRVSTRSGQQAYLLGGDGKLLYADAGGHSTASVQVLQDALGNGSRRIRIDGQNYMVMSAGSLRNGFSVLSMVPESEVFHASNRLFLEMTASMSLILLLTAGIVVLIARSVSTGIRRLNRAVSDFGATGGQEEIRLVPRSMDEVGQLTQGAVAMSRRIARLLEQTREDERTKWQLEFRALQSQINPHMVYNTLNTISYLAQLQNVSNIEDVSTSFARLLRMVACGNGEFITIQEELNCVRAFVAIKRYNLPWDIQYRVEADEGALSCRVLKLLMQPFVENAIVHGFSGCNASGTVHVSVTLAQGQITVQITDDGAGMDPKTLERNLSGPSDSPTRFSNVGIYNTVRRLSLTYGQRASFHMESAPGRGTKVRIAFPAEPLEQGKEGA